MRQPTRQRAETAVGDLRAYLTAHRAAGESLADIAYDLRSTHDVTVSAEGVRLWCLDLGVRSEA